MDVNTATNYNYTCLSDAGCKSIIEDAHSPFSFHKACYKGLTALNLRTEQVMMAAS
jgi:hypothetical protein